MDITPDQAVATIRQKFTEMGGKAKIPLQRGHAPFKARLNDGGIEVSNLARNSFLPWPVFQEAIKVLIRNGGRARRGNAMGSLLGEPTLSLDSVEGHIAHTVYGKTPGETVFRRISPVAAILVWAEICTHAPGELVLCELP